MTALLQKCAVFKLLYVTEGGTLLTFCLYSVISQGIPDTTDP